MRVRIQEMFHKASYGIWILSDKIGQQKGVHVAKPLNLEFEFKGNGNDTFHLPEPTLEIRYSEAQEFLQSLCNSLIEQGIRPNNDKTAGELEATKKHLKDLQDIVNKTLHMLDKK